MIIYSNKRTEVDLICQITSWSAKLTPFCIEWWYVPNTHIEFSITIICITLAFDFWWFDD